jgi:hypothetical protein
MSVGLFLVKFHQTTDFSDSSENAALEVACCLHMLTALLAFVPLQGKNFTL